MTVETLLKSLQNVDNDTPISVVLKDKNNKEIDGCFVKRIEVSYTDTDFEEYNKVVLQIRQS